ERLLRRHRAQFLEKSYAVDELDALLCRQARRLAREPARGHENALAHLRRGHLAAQLAHRLDADGIGAPRLAVQDQRAAPGAERFEIGGAQLLEAPPLELLEELEGPFAGVEPPAPRHPAARLPAAAHEGA